MQPGKFGIIKSTTYAVVFMLLYLPLRTVSAIEPPAKIQQSGFYSLLAHSTFLTDTIKSNKKLKSNVKQKGVYQQNDSLYFDDSNDDEMYTPYEKWRIDTFDNWGKHNKKNVPQSETDTSAVDTVKVHKGKGFSDKDKESMLIAPTNDNFVLR